MKNKALDHGLIASNWMLNFGSRHNYEIHSHNKSALFISFLIRLLCTRTTSIHANECRPSLKATHNFSDFFAALVFLFLTLSKPHFFAMSKYIFFHNAVDSLLCCVQCSANMLWLSTVFISCARIEWTRMCDCAKNVLFSSTLRYVNWHCSCLFAQQI